MRAEEGRVHTSTLVIWGVALLLYGGFWLWYVGIPRPLTTEEIDAHLAVIAAADLPVGPEQLVQMRAFLEADDGGEFFMLNLVKVSRDKVMAPGATEPQDARTVLEGYTGHFMPALMRRAGHPAYFGRAAAGYLEQGASNPIPVGRSAPRSATAAGATCSSS
jgi:hypothetical protein